MKNATISQAIEMGFDFSQFLVSTTIEELTQALTEFFNDRGDALPQIEDECEVRTSGNNQTVDYRGHYSCSGDIVRFQDHWRDPVGTKVYHSSFVMIDTDGIAKQMNLYFTVEKTDFN